MKNCTAYILALVLTISMSYTLAQNDGYLIEENCDNGESETVCSRTYSTNALDLIKNANSKNEQIDDLNEASVSEHIRRIEEKNVKAGTALPYKNEEEKEQYVKSLYYNKILAKSRLDRESEFQQIPTAKILRVNVAFKTPMSPNIYDMDSHPLYDLPEDEASLIIKDNAAEILAGLNESEYSDVSISRIVNSMSLSINEDGLAKLFLNPNVLQITPKTKLKALN